MNDMRVVSFRKIIFILLVFGTLVGTISLFQVSADKTSKTISDLAGRTVDIPTDVDRVAALVGPSYEKIFLLGALDKICLTHPLPKQMPWAKRVIPNLSNIPSVTSAQDPNMEELVNQNVDLVFFWDFPKPVDKMNDIGIPVVVTQTTTTDQQAQSIEQFRELIKGEVTLFGEVLGQDAQKKVEDYNNFFDEKVDRILKVTSLIPESERPKVYYVRGPDPLTTHGKNMYTQWWVEMAGGKLVSADISEGVPKVSIEQVISWNPDIIVMGRVNSTSPILDDPTWSDISAVKTGKVYTNPEGVMYWDYSSEGVLLLEYLAKLFHPEKFENINMNDEIKEYYAKFYGYSLTYDEAERILHHLPPA
ncbi:MAG: ABC transporter substrate-binding protein [Methanomicrobiales archaeon]|nr:ABC transporter substrate-binding protein [Methanomicrobiales archaeon]